MTSANGSAAVRTSCFSNVVLIWVAKLQDQEMQRGEPRGSSPPFSLVTVTDANALRSPAAADSNAGTSP